MKKLLFVFATVFTISGTVLAPLTASAQFSPTPRANFTSPSFGYSTSADYVNISFDLNLNGQSSLVNKTLQVFPVICNFSAEPEDFLCELDQTSGITASFTDSYASQQYTFSNVAMQYLGNNDVTCFIYDSSTENGDFCGGDTPNLVRINYTGALLPVYRFWSSTKQHHFYTQSSEERDAVIANYDDSEWEYEGIAYYTSRTEACRGSGVFRFWSEAKQSHFYTVNEDEKNYIISHYSQRDWKYEGVAFCADSAKQNGRQTEVYRFWSNSKQGHFYTSNKEERDYIISTYSENEWKYEGVAYYASTD